MKNETFKKVASVVLASIMMTGVVGNVAFSNQVFAATGYSVDEAEDIVFGESYNVTWTESTDHLNYYIKFEVPENGVITIKAKKPINPVDNEYGALDLCIYDSTGTKKIWSYDTLYEKSDAKEDYIIHVGLASGIYYMTVKPHFYVYSGGISSDISLEFAKGNYEIEQNNSIGSATKVSEGSMFTGYLGAGEELFLGDFYSFDLEADNAYRIKLYNWEELELTTAIVHFIGPDEIDEYTSFNDTKGNVVSFYKFENNYEDGANYFEFIPNITGTYYVQVENYYGLEIQYGIALEKIPLPDVGPNINFSRNVSDAEKIEYGTSYYSSWTSLTSEINHYMKIEVPKNGLIALDATKPKNKDNKYCKLDLCLFDSTGNKKIWDSDTYEEVDNASDKYSYHIGLAAGTYYLTAKPYEYNVSGVFSTNITLSFSEGCYEIEQNNSKGSATKVSEGSIVTAYIGDEATLTNDDYFSFDLIAGTPYRINIVNWEELEPADVYLGFAGPNKVDDFTTFEDTKGNKVYFYRDIQENYENGLNYFEFIPKVTGTYYVQFYNYGSQEIQYCISLVNLSKTNSSTMVTETPKPTAVPTKTPAKEDSDSGVEGFVERLYTVAMGRESDKSGKAYWAKEVKENGKTGADLALAFLLSDEFLGKNMSNDQFINVLYKTFFDRQADQGGKDYWNGQMKNGMSKTDVIMGYINSPEWANICLTYGIKSGTEVKPTITIKPNQDIKNFAERLYTTCLNRPSEADGLNYWASELANLKQSGSQVAKGFFFSAEFVNSNLSDAEYLTRLYKTVMGRDPEASGFNYWLGEMKAGRMSRSDVFDGFAASPEWIGICADYGILR